MREYKKIFTLNSHSVIGSVMREPELQEFVKLKTSKHKLSYDVSDTVRSAVDRFVEHQVPHVAS